MGTLVGAVVTPSDKAIERGVHDTAEAMTFVCERSRIGCTAKLTVPRRAYERARAHFDRFLVAPGHERPVIEELARGHGAGPDVLGRLRLAVSEAVTNVVLHAYDDGEAGTVICNAQIADGALEILIRDGGHGIRDRPSPGLGMGIKIIAEVSDDFAISPVEPHGLVVRMRFALR